MESISLSPWYLSMCSRSKSYIYSSDLTFSVDPNYGSVVQGNATFLKDTSTDRWIPRKGSIILQNDVWIGHGATVMPGVILRNGCVVATDAVVTKDVPPYAIVGGNPAKIIRYRFDESTILGLQKIAWWGIGLRNYKWQGSMILLCHPRNLLQSTCHSAGREKAIRI